MWLESSKIPGRGGERLRCAALRPEKNPRKIWDPGVSISGLSTSENPSEMSENGIFFGVEIVICEPQTAQNHLARKHREVSQGGRNSWQWE